MKSHPEVIASGAKQSISTSLGRLKKMDRHAALRASRDDGLG
jgi:hypothetical protein